MNRQELLRVAEEARENDKVTSAIIDDFGTRSTGFTIRGRSIPQIVQDVINQGDVSVSHTRVNLDGEIEQRLFMTPKQK